MSQQQPTLNARLDRRARESFVGREAEMAVLETLLAPEGPLVVHLHGIPGMGKSTLLARFAESARQSGAAAEVLDCRLIEPTPRGFLTELGRALDTPLDDLDAAAETLGNLGSPCVLGLDHYESLLLLDTWLRQDFLPALPDTCRLVLAGRRQPVPGWNTSPHWHGLFRAITLRALPLEAARELLVSSGVEPALADQWAAITHGNPLALKMAAAAVPLSPGTMPVGESAIQEVMQQLTDLFLGEVDDDATRDALQCASVARRITRPLLDALPNHQGDQYEELQRLPFIDVRRDGLRIHGAVHEAMARTLRAADPARHNACRRRVWQLLRDELRTAPREDIWRYTADMLYLVANPAVREAFFPSGEQELAMEPATAEDFPAIVAIIDAHEGPQARAALTAWWELPSAAFRVGRDATGQVVTFYCMAEAGDLTDEVRADDPVANTWCRHLDAHPLPMGCPALLLRRWLTDDTGEAPSAAQAACWLDIKRTYMELRPALRRVYLTVVDLPTYAEVATRLGFVHLADCTVTLDGTAYQSALMDLGPASVDGWITRLVGDELGVDTSGPLDRENRALELEGRQVALTPLEYKLAAYLEDLAGTTATRDELLTGVWEYADGSGSSNVVDAVVKSLRRKLEGESWRLETVRGFGYRWRNW